MEQARRAQQMVQRCKMQEKSTETDMAEFSQQRRPSTETGKCLHACLMETVGLVCDYLNLFFVEKNEFPFSFSITDIQWNIFSRKLRSFHESNGTWKQ